MGSVRWRGYRQVALSELWPGSTSSSGLGRKTVGAAGGNPDGSVKELAFDHHMLAALCAWRGTKTGELALSLSL